MLAIVLSGAANYGAMQAGALKALFETGLQPSLVVGTSAGALNAIYTASDPRSEGMDRLGILWEDVGPYLAGRPSLFTGLRRVITHQESLLPNAQLAEFLVSRLTQQVDSFGLLAGLHGLHAYTTAVCIETGELVIFGDREHDLLLDGAMASTAIPPYFPPWRVDGRRYVDGGLVTKLPVRVAIQRGAAQVVALDVKHAIGSPQAASDLIGISNYAISLMADYQSKSEMNWARSTGVALRVITLPPPPEVHFWDYSQARFLFDLGYQIARRSLESEPLQIKPAWQARLRKNLTSAFRNILGASN